MNKILYVLIGGAVAVVIGIRLFDNQASRPIKFDETDLAAAALCLLATAAGLLFLTQTRLGRRFKAWIDKRNRDDDDRVRTTPGKVREPTGTNIP
jgi:branched-subunit amino acid ABC-type transport system permease component